MTVAENGDNDNGATAGRADFRARAQFALACLQLGIAFADLARYGVQIAIPEEAQSNAHALGALAALQRAIAQLNATARTDAGLIVP